MNLIKAMGLLQFLAMILVLSGLVFLVIDCTGGTVTNQRVLVFHRERKAAWVEPYIEYVTQYDGNGYTRSHPVQKTRFHPEEYILYVHGYDGNLKVPVNEVDFYAIKVNQEIEIKVMYGGLTKWRYSTWISNF